MTTTLKFHSGARAHLVAEGFTPASSKRAAGLQVEWTNADGRKAHVAFCLLSRTGQSSRGAGAVWGYVVTIDEPALSKAAA